MKRHFRDRVEAGTLLAVELDRFLDRPRTVVLALPRGGVPVGHTVARHLRVPFDILVVRKLGVPGHEETALGAIASGGIHVINRDLVGSLRLSPAEILQVTEREQAELARRERVYRGECPAFPVAGCTAILVDDGVATGASITAAIRSLRRQRAGWIVAAAPVMAAEANSQLRREADEVVAVLVARQFHAVGEWYRDFSEVTDDEVRHYLSFPTTGGAAPPGRFSLRQAPA
jgi:predicted phosphoribosyltransferase